MLTLTGKDFNCLDNFMQSLEGLNPADRAKIKALTFGKIFLSEILHQPGVEAVVCKQWIVHYYGLIIVPESLEVCTFHVMGICQYQVAILIDDSVDKAMGVDYNS